MKRLFLFSCIFSLLLAACGDNDDDIHATNSEHNWLVVEDSDDPIDHHRYLIYESTGIPIYYNDTIGSEERYSAISGEYYTYYEVLQVFYTPGSTTPSESTANYVLVQNRDDVADVLDFLETEVLPQVPESVYIPSILLVDSLTTPSGDTIAYKGFNTVVLSKICAFDEMNESDKSLYTGSFLAALITNAFEDEWLEDNFYSITYEVNPGNESYMYSTGTSLIGYAVYRAYSGMDVAQEDQTLGGLGFICTYRTPTSTSERMWEVPTKTQDVTAFCKEILSYTEAEFIEMHGEYEVVMEKYYVLREKLQELGFTLK